MSFFQTILDSIENPNHAGSQQDLSGLLNLAQALPLGQGHGAQQNLQPILGVLGTHLQDALSQHNSRTMARLPFNRQSPIFPNRGLVCRSLRTFSARNVSTV